MCKEDDTIDALHAQMFADVLGRMTADPSLVVVGTTQLFVSKPERIADHATNIAEMVILHGEGQEHPAPVRPGDDLGRMSRRSTP